MKLQQPKQKMEMSALVAYYLALVARHGTEAVLKFLLRIIEQQRKGKKS